MTKPHRAQNDELSKRRGKPRGKQPRNLAPMADQIIMDLLTAHMKLFSKRPFKNEDIVVWVDALEVFNRAQRLHLLPAADAWKPPMEEDRARMVLKRMGYGWLEKLTHGRK